MRSAAHHRLALLLSTALPSTMAPGSAVAAPDLRADRYGTAARVASSAIPEGADVAILASGESGPDALRAAPLAALYDAPILLTRRTSVPADTRRASPNSASPTSSSSADRQRSTTSPSSGRESSARSAGPLAPVDRETLP